VNRAGMLPPRPWGGEGPWLRRGRHGGVPPGDGGARPAGRARVLRPGSAMWRRYGGADRSEHRGPDPPTPW